MRKSRLQKNDSKNGCSSPSMDCTTKEAAIQITATVKISVNPVVCACDDTMMLAHAGAAATGRGSDVPGAVARLCAHVTEHPASLLKAGCAVLSCKDMQRHAAA